jgi:hypothetical protein
MGLFVVGRLAQRNDIHVQLQSAPVGQGTIAVVTVPAMLLMTPAQAAAAEMATSEFPAATGPASGSWAVPEPAVPAPRTPPRPVEPAYAWQEPPVPPVPPAAVPAPRGPRDSAPVTGWSEFEVGTEVQRPPTGRRPEWTPPAPPAAPPSLPRRAPQGPTPAQQIPGQQIPSQQQIPFQQQIPSQQQLPGQQRPGQQQVPGQQVPAPVPPGPANRGDGPTGGGLFDAGPAAEVPDDSPIYDEVRTSWFRMDQLAGSTGANAAYPGAGRPAEAKADPAPAPAPRGLSGPGGPGARGPAEPSRQPGSSPSTPRPGARPEVAPAPAPAPARTPAPVFEDRSAEPPAPPRPAAAPASAAPASAPAADGDGQPNGNGHANGNGAAADPLPDGSSPEWGPIDNGWRAAREFTELTREFLTDAGLPKRRAGGRPLPGSFAETAPSSGPSARNPDAVRGRLREYQRGLRHGRYAQHDHVGEPTASSTAAGPE